MLRFLFNNYNSSTSEYIPRVAPKQTHEIALGLYNQGSYSAARALFQNQKMNYWAHRTTMLIKTLDKLHEYTELEKIYNDKTAPFNRSNPDLLFVFANALMHLARSQETVFTDVNEHDEFISRQSTRRASALDAINEALVARPGVLHYRALRAQILIDIGTNETLHWAVRDYTVLIESTQGNRRGNYHFQRAEVYTIMMNKHAALHNIEGLRRMILEDLANALSLATMDSLRASIHLARARVYSSMDASWTYSAINDYMLFLAYDEGVNTHPHDVIMSELRRLEGAAP